MSCAAKIRTTSLKPASRLLPAPWIWRRHSIRGFTECFRRREVSRDFVQNVQGLRRFKVHCSKFKGNERQERFHGRGHRLRHGQFAQRPERAGACRLQGRGYPRYERDPCRARRGTSRGRRFQCVHGKPRQVWPHRTDSRGCAAAKAVLGNLSGFTVAFFGKRRIRQAKGTRSLFGKGRWVSRRGKSQSATHGLESDREKEG